MRRPVGSSREAPHILTAIKHISYGKSETLHEGASYDYSRVLATGKSAGIAFAGAKDFMLSEASNDLVREGPAFLFD